jgi:DNA-binding SARP family transcriptional activator
LDLFYGPLGEVSKPSWSDDRIGGFLVLKKFPSSRQPPLNKITPPGLHRTAQRERLFHLLEQSASAQGIWVSGPAGAGKSTLVESYLAARRIPRIWYRVDSSDNDPASFFYHMGLAVDRAADQTKPKLPLLTPAYMHGLDAFSARYFERLSQRLAPSVWIVFDNDHEVPPDSPLQGILAQALRHVAAGVRLCIISRSDPGPVMARLLANRMMNLVDGAQLAFTAEEYRQVLKVLGYPQKILQKAEALHQLTGGWIAGLILWLQHAQSLPEGRSIAENPPALIFDYFANEVLDQLEPQLRHFLLQASFLLEMTPENTASLTGTPVAGEILESLARRNFFIEKHSDGSIRYQFHSLFKDFLQDRAVKTLPSDTVQDLCCRAAAIMAEGMLWDESVRLYEQARNWEALTELILSRAPELAAQGRFKTLTDWLGKVPPTVCESNPFLLLWSGITRMPDQPREGQERCVQAFEDFKSADDILGQVMSWCDVVDSFFLIRSDFKALDKWIEEGLRIAHHLSDEVDPNLYGRFCSGMVGAFLWRRPNHPDMPRWQQKGEHLLAVSTDTYTIAALLNVLCFSYNLFGQVNKATALRGRLDALMKQLGQEPVLQALWAANEGMCLLGEGLPQQCLRQCEKALQCAEETGIHIYDSLVISGSVYGILLLGRVEEADEYLQKLSDHIPPDARWDWTNYYALSTWAAILSDDIHKAKVLADSNLELLDLCGTPYNLAYMILIRAQAMLRLGDISGAQSDLDRVAAMNIIQNVPLLKFIFELTAADRDIIGGRRMDALGHLHNAFSTAAENGCYFIFGFNRNRMPELCALALEHGIETTFVAELIHRNQLPPPSVCFPGDFWPYDMKLYTLGRLEIYRNGKLIALSPKKTPRKTMDLFTTLICAGSKGMTREMIADLLWPDTDGDRAQQNMNTTLHRLRKLLKKEGAIVNENGYLVLSRQCCWVDCWAFEELHDQAMASGVPAQKAEMLGKAVSLYAGPMEAHAVAELSVSYAERLKSKFVQSILELGWYLCENGRPNEALRLYQHALDIEESVENVYQAYIRVLNRLGRKTEAIEIYSRCCRVLKARFGTEPSPATQALYREATSAAGC